MVENYALQLFTVTTATVTSHGGLLSLSDNLQVTFEQSKVTRSRPSTKNQGIFAHQHKAPNFLHVSNCVSVSFTATQ